jgi:hypothetical protein
MRLQRALPVLAAVITLGGSAVPAYGFQPRDPEPGGAGPTPTVTIAAPRAIVSHTHSTGSNDAVLDIGVGLVAGLAIGSIGYAAYAGRSSRGAAKGRRVAAGRS